MKKSILYSIIAVMLFVFICMICVWEVQSFEEKKGAESQKIEKTFEYGDVRLIVETDRTVYGLYDFIYVTATLVNYSDETLTFFTSTSTGGVHEELITAFCQGDFKMLDVDMHIADYPEDGGTFTLAPGAQYVQVMRFSPIMYQDKGIVCFKNDTPPCGFYQGTVTANLVLGGEVKPLTLEFQVEVIEEELADVLGS